MCLQARPACSPFPSSRGPVPALVGAPSPRPGDSHLRTLPFCAGECTEARLAPRPPLAGSLALGSQSESAFRALRPEGSLRPCALSWWHRGTEAEVLVYWLTRLQREIQQQYTCSQPSVCSGSQDSAGSVGSNRHRTETAGFPGGEAGEKVGGVTTLCSSSSQQAPGRRLQGRNSHPPGC